MILNFPVLSATGQHGRRRVGLGADLAAEPLAEPAVGTAAAGDPVRVRVRGRQVRGRGEERVVAELAGGLPEQRAYLGVRGRLDRELARARPLEHIASGDDLAVEVPGLAGDPGHVVELVHVRLELVVGDSPVLDRHSGRDRRGAVPVDRARTDREVARMEPPGLPVPVRRPRRRSRYRAGTRPAAGSAWRSPGRCGGRSRSRSRCSGRAHTESHSGARRGRRPSSPTLRSCPAPARRRSGRPSSARRR